ncbi:MAG: transposase [Candidatus Methanofastidiosum sp.]|nr:transposase [Methanofastidiosum sp.]
MAYKISDESRLARNQKVKDRQKETRERRKSQDTKVVTLKLDRSRMLPATLHTITNMYKEARYLYNYILSTAEPYNKKKSEEYFALRDALAESMKEQFPNTKDILKEKKFIEEFKKVREGLKDTEKTENPIFTFSDKTVDIKIKTKEGFEDRKLEFLPAKLRQSIIAGLKTSVYALSQAIKKGIKIGRLKYIKTLDTLTFTQVNMDFILNEIPYTEERSIDKPKYRIKLLGIKQHLYVQGSYQLPNEYELAGNAKLIRSGNDFYIALTICTPKEVQKRNDKVVGLDYGISTAITTSDGKKYGVKIEESDRLKKLQRKMARQERFSHNWYKTKNKIQKEYRKAVDKKSNFANRIVSTLDKKYGTIIMQDENLVGWQHGRFGKQVGSSALGAIKAKLKNNPKTVFVSRYASTTQVCSNCGHKLLTKLELSDRLFVCPECGYTEDRDINAAKSIKNIGLATK